MELNRKHFHAIIFYNFRRVLTQQQCIDELNSIFDEEASSRTSIYRWYGEFHRDRSSLQDEFCEGRPKSVVAPETIEHEHLTAKEIYSRWIPHNLSIAQKKPCVDWHI